MKRGGKGIAGRHLLISHIDTDITSLIIAMRETLDHFKSTSKKRKEKRERKYVEAIGKEQDWETTWCWLGDQCNREQATWDERNGEK